MFNDSKQSDNVKFSKSYTYVSEENIYKYINLQELNDILESESGIIIIGKTTDAWMQVLVNPLHDIVKEYTDVIYYLELDDITDEDDYYSQVTDEVGDLSSPSILIIKDGNILTTLHKKDLIEEDYDGIPLEYYTADRIEELRNKLEKITELN